MFGSNAVKDVNVSTLDAKRLAKYEALPGAIEALDDWILVPNAELLNKLLSYTTRLKNIARLPAGTKLYRGFDPSSSYQDTMGLSKKGFFFNEVKNHKVGDTFDYTIKRPMSFTTDLDIAQAFGNTVVEYIGYPTNYIWITDELSSLVSKRRKIGPETQREVILLPTQDLVFKIVQK